MDQLVGTLYNEWMLTFLENLSQFEENLTAGQASDEECEYCSVTCRQTLVSRCDPEDCHSNNTVRACHPDQNIMTRLTI